MDGAGRVPVGHDGQYDAVLQFQIGRHWHSQHAPGSGRDCVGWIDLSLLSLGAIDSGDGLYHLRPGLSYLGWLAPPSELAPLPMGEGWGEGLARKLPPHLSPRGREKISKHETRFCSKALRPLLAG